MARGEWNRAVFSRPKMAAHGTPSRSNASALRIRAVDGLADAIVLLQHLDGETLPRKPLRGIEPGRPAPHDQHIGCGVDGGSEGKASLPPQLTAWRDPPQHEIAKPALRTS
jgi:hypothetical protein